MRTISHFFEENVLIKRFPETELRDTEELVVKKNQLVLIYKDAHVLERYQEGTHQLVKRERGNWFQRHFPRWFRKKEEENKYMNAELFFVNLNPMSHAFAIQDDFIIQDPKEHLYLYLDVKGEMTIQINNIEKFMGIFAHDKETQFTMQDLKKTLRAKMNIIIKEKIYTSVMRDDITFTAMIKHLNAISEDTKLSLSQFLDEYGLKIEKLLIEEIAPKKTFFDQIISQQQDVVFNKQKIQNDSLKTVEMGKAKAEARKSQGYTYQQERQFDVLEALAARHYVKTDQGEDVLGKAVDSEVGKNFGDAISKQISGTTSEAFITKK